MGEVATPPHNYGDFFDHLRLGAPDESSSPTGRSRSAGYHSRISIRRALP